MSAEYIIEEVRRFIGWSSKKIELHFSVRPGLYFYEREVWWASLGENIGSEENGKNYNFERPVIIVKKFSKDVLFIIPTTSGLKEGTWYHPVECEGIISRAVLVQARTISAKRLIRKIGLLPVDQFELLHAAFIDLIKTNTPA